MLFFTKNIQILEKFENKQIHCRREETKVEYNLYLSLGIYECTSVCKKFMCKE